MSRWIKVATVVAVAAIVAVMTGGAGATSSPARSTHATSAEKAQKVTRIDVSTPAAVVHYLRSIHVNAKAAVIQRGGLNYAGAHCPGKAWSCVTSFRHTVVQISKRGGQNRAVCRSSHCVVVQISGVSRGVYVSGRQLAGKGGGSTASCVKSGSGATTGTGQFCTISQLGTGPNTAGVYENTQKVSGLVQTAQYTALITQQSSGSNPNTACVTQIINLDGSNTNTNGKPTAANLQAHQSVTIRQDATGSGANSAVNGATSVGGCDTTTLGQSQTLTSTITATGQITQTEDATYNSCGDNVTGDYANLCLDIEQNQGPANGVASGTNNATFVQNSTQTAIANATKGAKVIQQQSTPPCTDSSAPANCLAPSGLVGTINQDSSGVSTATATQNEVQCEDAAISGLTACSSTPDSPNIPGGLTQKQYGPVGVGNVRHHRGRVLFGHLKGLGQAKQTGNPPNPNDSYTITQISTQNADQGATQQNNGRADCTTNGQCQAAQTTTVNGSGTSDGYTAPTIGGLTINCTGANCQATPPPAPEITGTPDAETTSTSATFTWTEGATAGVTLKCSIDGGSTFQTCDSPTSTTYTGLSHGPHTFVVKAVDNTASHNASATDSFTWTIVPYLTFETTNDGASAGWSGTPGASPITLTTGSDSGTFAQFTIHDRTNLKVSDLASAVPSFNTDTYVGAPRYEIDLDNGDYLFGYPPQAGFGSNSWDINCGGTNNSCVAMSFVSWPQVQAAEGSATITDVLIEADFPTNYTYSILNFTFDNYGPSDVVP